MTHVTLTLAFVLACAASASATVADHGSRRIGPDSSAGTEITAAVTHAFAKLAGTPRSGFVHGTKVALAPICGSRSDGTYAIAVAYPYGFASLAGLGDPAVVYVRHAKSGYSVLAVLDGTQLDQRPAGLPLPVFQDLNPAHRAQCPAWTDSQIVALIKNHGAPLFRI
jgi:hypothetical protein